MDLRVDEKGKYYTQRVVKDCVPVVVRTTDYLITGDIHVRPDLRIKDEFDGDQSRFLPITEATVYDATGQRMLYQTHFMMLAYAHVVIICPQEAITNANDAPWQPAAQEPSA